MRRIHWLAVVVLTLALVVPAAAQEVQVPLDEAGRVTTVDRDLARRLGLWVEEHPGFREARLFQAPDSTFVLEITTERAGVAARTRIPLSAAEVVALRARVSALTAAAAPERLRTAVNQEGRYLLLGQTTLAGVSFYGWAVPYVVGADGSGALGLYLLTAGASFFLPFALTEGAPVTFGMANLSRYGVTRGILHGLLLHQVVAGEEEEEILAPCPEGCYVDDTDDAFDRTRTAMALAASVGEGLAGYLWARNEEMTAGTAGAMATGGDFGLGYGLGAATLLGLDEESGSERVGAALGLAGTAAGVLGGRGVARRRDYVWGDTDVIYTGGALGAWSGLAVASVVDDELDSEELAVGAAMLGSAAGLYLADHLVRDTDFSVGQATLNRLGTLAGALAGASIGAGVENARVAMVGSALGGILGYYGTYAALAPQARAGRGDRLTGLDVQLHPVALLGARGAAGRGALPLLSVRYRF